MSYCHMTFASTGPQFSEGHGILCQFEECGFFHGILQDLVRADDYFYFAI